LGKGNNYKLILFNSTMGDIVLWTVFAIIILVFLVLLIKILTSKNKEYKPDYYTLFSIGIVWVAIGIPLKNWGLFGMGIVFSITGLLNKDKWEKNHMKLDKKKRKAAIIALILGLLFLVLFLFLFILLK
jgi:small-conductance mechanosensitive channel